MSWTEHLRARSFPELRRALATLPRKELLAAWPSLSPLERLICFKLLDAASALSVFEALPFEERYFLFSGFAADSVAPVLEDLPASERRLFVALPKDAYDRMFRGLLGEARARSAT